MAISFGPLPPCAGWRPSAIPFPTPIALPPPIATTTSTCFSAPSALAASTASRGTCGATSVNSAANRLPSDARTRAACVEDFRLGVQTKRTCCPSASASAPTRSTAPRPKRTRGALSVQPLLGERTALHGFERVGLDLQQFPIRALEVERVLYPIRPEILNAASIEFSTDAIQLVARNGNRDMVHAADRFPRGRHRILRKVEEGEQVSVPEVMEEVSRALQVPILKQLHQWEAENLAVKLDSALDIRADQRQVVKAARAGRRALRFWFEICLFQCLALRLVIDLDSGHRPSCSSRS